MWADVLLSAERQHLLRLFVWAGLSIVAGTILITVLLAKRIRSPLLAHFAMQSAGWGLIVALIAFFAWRGLHLRDVSGAARLERLVWMNTGLDLGYVGIGITLMVVGRLLGRRMSLVGAGVGIVIQGVGLFLLDLQFAGVVSR